MTDREFDRLLYQEADLLLSEDLTDAIPNPWKPAITKICWGLALTSITLNFLYLNYLLPTLGGILLWLGFRSLRRENHWLGLGHVLSLLLLILRLARYAALATPLAPALQGKVSPLLVLGHNFVVWLVYLFLWLGLRRVFLQAGLPPKTGAAGGLVFGYAVMFLLALVPIFGWLIILALLIVWIFLIRGLYLTSLCLDEAGYGVTPAPVRVSDRWAALLWLGIILAATLTCRYLFAVPPAQGEPARLETGQEELREELLSLGFPREVLEDLTDEEVARLKGASKVTVGDTGYDVADDGLLVHISSQEPENLDLRLIKVLLPQEDAIVFYGWFQWDGPPDHAYLDGLQAIPNFHETTSESYADHFYWRMLWEEEGQLLQTTLSAEDPVAPSASFTAESFGAYLPRFAQFSLPEKGESIRGYMSWRLFGFDAPCFFNSSLTYVHQRSLPYPWDTPYNALRTRMQTWASFYQNDAFQIQEMIAMTHYSNTDPGSDPP